MTGARELKNTSLSQSSSEGESLRLKRLRKILNKSEKLVIGLMSGTSCDGLDIALCTFRNRGFDTSVKLRGFLSLPYDAVLRKQLLSLSSADQISLQELCFWNSKLADLHADMILNALEKWKVSRDEVDLIGSHGHTLYHSPDNDKTRPYPTTLQIGDGDHIATRTGILTISDFRQKETARGRQGAPLAGYADALLFGKEDENQFMANIGGIANISWLKPGKSVIPFTTDTGPGNTMIDDAVRFYFSDKHYDQGGDIAYSGKVHAGYLKKMLDHPFFKEPYPKSTGRELFNREFWQSVLPENLSPEDVITTISRLTIVSLADVIIPKIQKGVVNTVSVSGGGAHNKFLMSGLQRILEGAKVEAMFYDGITADSKEASMFAVFANEAISGTGVLPMMGKFSFPE